MGNPTEDLITNTVEKLQAQHAVRDRQKDIAIENMEEWKESLNRLFKSPDGKLLAKYLLRYCGVFNVDDTSNHVKMLENIGKRSVYLQLIRPHLDVITKTEIENQG